MGRPRKLDSLLLGCAFLIAVLGVVFVGRRLWPGGVPLTHEFYRALHAWSAAILFFGFAACVTRFADKSTWKELAQALLIPAMLVSVINVSRFLFQTDFELARGFDWIWRMIEPLFWLSVTFPVYCLGRTPRFRPVSMAVTSLLYGLAATPLFGTTRHHPPLSWGFGLPGWVMVLLWGVALFAGFVGLASLAPESERTEQSDTVFVTKWMWVLAGWLAFTDIVLGEYLPLLWTIPSVAGVLYLCIPYFRGQRTAE